MTPTLRATLIGCIALINWAALAVVTLWAGDTPPFLLVGLAFGICALVAVAKWLIAGERIMDHLRQPVTAWVLGVTGLFGFHFLLFLALKSAPAVEANLINYMWPLLIVLFSGFLPGHRLRLHHVLGTVLGLSGAVLLVSKGGRLEFDARYAVGYGAAVASALVWAGYSVLSRLFAKVPTDAVGGFCAVGSLLAFACHAAFEAPYVPQGWEWAAIVVLGLGPAGGSFFVWDYGVKHGDIQVLGALSYTVPLLSTLLLIAFGMGAFTWQVVVACLLVVGGALLASREMLRALWMRRRGAGAAQEETGAAS